MRWTRPLTGLLAGLEKIFDRVLCAVGAVAGAQLPEFMQQYLQRLGGHLDEARRQLAAFANVARQEGLTLEQYLARLTGNADTAVVKTGGVIRGLIARVEELTAAEAALRNASPWTRLMVFFRHLDAEIASRTWQVFRPAVPTTLEGLAYAGCGVVLALGFYHGAIKWPLRRLRLARKAKGTLPA